MSSPFASLAAMEYPGRVLALGRDASGLFNVLIYAVTGRSPSSQARRLDLEGDTIWTRPTDPDQLRTGNLELLIYPAVILKDGLTGSNGRQTSDIAPASGLSPIGVLDAGLEKWSYEPDAPVFTPRISGCILPSGRAALSLLKRAADGGCLRFFFEVPLVPGKGKFVATYSGKNENPLPPFAGEPRDIGLVETTAQSTAEAVYGALRPQAGAQDLRVAVACVFAGASNMHDRHVFIINRQERT